MPIPPVVAGMLASPKRLAAGLASVGIVLSGVGKGVMVIGDTIRGAEQQVTAEQRILVAVVNQYEAQAEALRQQLAECDIELALCNGE